MNAIDILKQLVAIPSVSSLTNLPMLDTIEDLLTPHGWNVIRSTYISSDGLEKGNLIAIPERFGEQLPIVDLLFVCHTDTVPYREDWAGAIHLTEINGMLHGCGSCDVKGSLAGLLAAALDVDNREMTTSVAFAFTAEEEVGCIGAKKLIEAGLLLPRRVIVCEPTSLQPATAGKGYGLAEVIIRGHEAHSAFPARGVSAINAAAHFITKFEQWQATADRKTDDRFSPPHTTYNIGVLHGGSAKNIVAGECRFLVESRPIPADDVNEAGEHLRQLASQVQAERPRCSIEVNILRAERGFANKPGSQMKATLQSSLERLETGISFGSEATHFAKLVDEIVVIGPGNMETAHSERECIPIAELHEWTRAVKHLMIELPLS
jgi:acetylornithine deacetylase